MCEIRPATAEDQGAIRSVHEAAFGGPAEARIVELLQRQEKAIVSLVAVSEAQVVGHIVFSPATVENAPRHFQLVGLGPVGVLPAFQGRGIGSALIVGGLAICKRIGKHAVVVVGEPRYYQRFGFAPGSRYGLGNEYQATDEFMVLELEPGVLRGVSGLVKYAPEVSAHS